MTDHRRPRQELFFWAKAALPWAILHFGVVFTTAYLTNNSAAAVGVATWMVVILSGAVHYDRGKKDGLQKADRSNTP